jgi:hypothetical protein
MFCQGVGPNARKPAGRVSYRVFLEDGRLPPENRGGGGAKPASETLG